MAGTRKMAERRLAQELKSASPGGNNPFPEGISASPSEVDTLFWTATITGPPDTPYEAGKFDIHLKYPESYPFKAPEVAFLTKVFHPNITLSGKVCLDILADKWSPSYNIMTVLQQLQGLLAMPNAEDPLVKEPAVMMLQDPELFAKTAREMTLKHACPAQPEPVKDEAPITPRSASSADTSSPTEPVVVMGRSSSKPMPCPLEL